MIAYVLDGQNRRIGKTIDGSRVQGWLYRDPLKPVAERDGSGQVVARFVYGSNPLVPDYVLKGGAPYPILTGYVGTPQPAVDTTAGLVIQRRGSDARGRPA